MPDEEKDAAAHMVSAARAGSDQGMTREQFIASAGIFWDSWHKAREFMASGSIEEGEG